MFGLLKIELYKIFIQKTTYFTLILLFIISAIFLSELRGDSLYPLYKKWEGPVTQEDINKAKTLDTIIAKKQDDGKDISYKELKLRNVYSDIDRIDRFKDKQESTIKDLENKMEKTEGTGFKYRNLKLNKDLLSNIEYTHLEYQRPASQMLDYIGTYGFVIFGILIIIGLSNIFTQEYSTRVDNYIYTSRFGRKEIVHAKIFAALIYVIFIQIITISFGLIYWNIIEGNYGWGANIQSIDKYWDSPYGFTILEYFIISIGIQLLAGISFAFFVLLVSSLSKNSLISFLISGFIFAFPVFIETFIPHHMTLLNTLLKFTYTDGMLVNVLFKEYSTINLFGLPILYPVLSIILLIVSSIICLLTLYKVIKRKEVF